MLQHMQDEQLRLNLVKMLALAKFKESFVKFTNREIVVFSECLKNTLKDKRKAEQDEAINNALAKAEAVPAPRGLFGSFF